MTTVRSVAHDDPPSEHFTHRLFHRIHWPDPQPEPATEPEHADRIPDDSEGPY